MAWHPAILLILFTAIASASSGPAGWDIEDFMRIYFEQGDNAAFNHWVGCYDIEDGRAVGTCVPYAYQESKSVDETDCYKSCSSHYKEAVFESVMAYTDYLREYATTESGLQDILGMGDSEFDMFSSTYSSGGVVPELGDSTLQLVGNGVRIHLPEAEYPAAARKYGIEVPESYYLKYAGRIPLARGATDLVPGDPDVSEIRDVYLPYQEKSQAELTQLLSGIKAMRPSGGPATGDSAYGGGGTDTAGDTGQAGSLGSIDSVVPGGWYNGQMMVRSKKTAPNSAFQAALGTGLSAADAAALGPDIRSYDVNLPDSPAGKQAGVFYQNDSTLIEVTAETAAPISNISVATDVIDVYRHPELFKKSSILSTSEYPEPNIPQVQPYYTPIEVIGLHLHKTGEVVGMPVTTPTGTEEGAGLGSENFMNNYYFAFRLPPEIIQGGQTSGFSAITGSPDLMIKTEGDLQRIRLLHYDYVKEDWVELPTKSIGKCDLQMCMFVAGPAKGRSYYMVVLKNETMAAEQAYAPAVSQPPASQPTSQLSQPLAQPCAPAAAIMLLAFFTAARKY